MARSWPPISKWPKKTQQFWNCCKAWGLFLTMACQYHQTMTIGVLKTAFLQLSVFLFSLVSDSILTNSIRTCMVQPKLVSVLFHHASYWIDWELSQGLVMSTIPGKPARFLRPEPGVSCRFDPVTDAVIQVDNFGSTTHLVEFVLLADSPQIPQTHLRSSDGNLHTGDLFEKQLDGSYRFRGRDDDWIKSFEADRIDARFVGLHLERHQKLDLFVL